MIIGDVMIDGYMWGKVERISPEAPVPVVTGTSEENRLGGAANVALNVQSLGAVPILCSVIGSDSRSEILYNLLDKQGITRIGIIEDNSRVTTLKTRIISNHQHLLRVDREIDTPLAAECEQRFIKNILTILTENTISAIIFEDYDKGVITDEVIKNVVEEARKRSIPTLVDPKKRNFGNYYDVTLFKPNFKELTEGLKVDINKNDAGSINEAAKKLHEEKNISLVMITLSEAGVFISDGKTYKLIPAHIRAIADVSGAGDTVISVASLCLSSGLDSFTTAAIANMAGGLVCEKIGVVPIDKQHFKDEIKILKLDNARS
jgi:rfaE bifunctional protein kinase chain/domain